MKHPKIDYTTDLEKGLKANHYSDCDDMGCERGCPVRYPDKDTLALVIKHLDEVIKKAKCKADDSARAVLEMPLEKRRGSKEAYRLVTNDAVEKALKRLRHKVRWMRNGCGR